MTDAHLDPCSGLGFLNFTPTTRRSLSGSPQECLAEATAVGAAMGRSRGPAGKRAGSRCLARTPRQPRTRQPGPLIPR